MINFSRNNRAANNLAETLKLATTEAFNLHAENVLRTPDELAEFVLERICFECGGIVTYIPKAKTDTTARDKLIYAEFTGNNARELAKKYDLSVAWIYRVIKKERDENRHF